MLVSGIYQRPQVEEDDVEHALNNEKYEHCSLIQKTRAQYKYIQDTLIQYGSMAISDDR
jgi:hypothetical protein